MEQAVAVEFAFRGGFKRLDGRGSFVAEQRAQAERWCCFGFAVVSKWWASQWPLSGMRACEGVSVAGGGVRLPLRAH